MVHANAVHARAIHPEANRVAGYTLAIGFNALLLMLLLVPMTAPPDWTRPASEGPRISWYPPDPLPATVQPPVLPVQPPQARQQPPATIAPPVAPAAVAVESPPVLVEGGNELAPPVPVQAEGPVAISPPGGPVAGVRLEYLRAPAPVYPRAAARAGFEGTVLLEVLVDTDGRPLRVTVRDSSGHRRLDAAARDQVLQQWRFRPAMRNGQAVQAIGLVPVNFRLD
jgi:protein TonB